MKNRIFILIIGMFILASCHQKTKQTIISIIPQPVKITKNKAVFSLNKNTQILINDKRIKTIATFLSETIKNATANKLQIVTDTAFSKHINFIGFRLTKIKNNNKEAYRLKTEKNRILIEANTTTGLFYGLQTLYQLFPPNIFAKGESLFPISLPSVTIEDYPRFAYRGMHLDVSRHFFPKEFIKKYIDLIAFHKMNVFHWHLVDDQGWRIEIKKYPKLTKIGAWRVDRNNQPWREAEPAKPGEKATYGGFYTQNDIREIVQYAKDRHITIIPEIEMPAHVLSAIASYPYLSCTGDSIAVPTGSSSYGDIIYCAGKESTFEFLENVLSEVMELFPSKYIHIGGDEAAKTHWKKCTYCQKRIKDEGLKDENELQSYFIRRIEKYLNKHGRELIGWDEILEGGLAPAATVMSWRGISGGIAAAKQGHNAIMTPGSHCYFDHYQGDAHTEPLAIGGYTTLKKTYSYEPIPEDLDEQEAKFILGAQGNVWTEFIPNGKHVEYMSVPRMAALAEVVWSPKESRNWGNFNQRIQQQFKRYDNLNLNYCHGTTKIEINPIFSGDTVKVSLYNERYNPEIHYTIDGSTPNLNSPIYKAPITVTKTLTIKAVLLENGKVIGLPSEKLIAKHKAIGAKVNYLTPYTKYIAKGNITLTDGMTGGDTHNDGYWQGFFSSNMEVVLDFGKELTFSELTAGFYQKQASWIFLPKSVEFYKSNDNQNFNLIGKVKNNIPAKQKGNIIKRFSLKTNKQKARYLKVKANALINCPNWHVGAGKPAWIFADEITVN